MFGLPQPELPATFADFMAIGGGVLQVIIVTGVLMWFLILERLYWYASVFPGQKQQLLARWRTRDDHQSWQARVIRRQWLSEQTVAMTFSLPMIKALIALCPLLGLLGTVLGMLEVFDVMTLRGQSDPRAMASGVSHAMIATLSGLAVSLSGMFFTGYFERRAAREGHDLALALEVKHHAL